MHHSTDLNRLLKHCELSFITPIVNREMFHTGTAAHAVIEELTLRRPSDHSEAQRIAEQTVRVLTTKGRSFDGVPEPPLPLEPCLEGARIALDYIAQNGIPEGEPELGLAMDAHGEPCTYLSPESVYGAVIDLVNVTEIDDEEYAYIVCEVTDYKTAWTAGADELDTLQRKGQAVLAYKHYGEKVDAIRLRVVNLRTGQERVREIFLDPESIEMLRDWDREILLLCTVADKALKEKRPRTGANCIGCHHAVDCEHAYAAAVADEAPSNFAACTAVLESLKPIMRERLKDTDPVDGVGFWAKERRTLSDDAVPALVTEWLKGQPVDDAQKALLEAQLRAILVACKPTVSMADNLAKVTHPGRENAASRREFMDGITGTVTYAEFGVKAP